MWRFRRNTKAGVQGKDGQRTDGAEWRKGHLQVFS